MGGQLSFAEAFKNNKPKDNFFNLRRTEDISTIYHQEYLGKVEGDMSYWCEPPTGFRHDCDYILGVFGELFGLAIGVIEKPSGNSYTLLTKNKEKFPTALTECGITPFTPYGEVDIDNIVNMVN